MQRSIFNKKTILQIIKTKEQRSNTDKIIFAKTKIK